MPGDESHKTKVAIIRTIAAAIWTKSNHGTLPRFEVVLYYIYLQDFFCSIWFGDEAWRWGVGRQIK